MAFPIASPPTASSPPRARPRPASHRPRTLGAADRGRLEPRGARAGAFESLRARALTPLDEVRVLDALAFAELPLPTVLELEVPGWSGPVWLRSDHRRGAVTDAPVLDGAAWRALAIAVASDRVRPADFRALLAVLARRDAGAPNGGASSEGASTEARDAADTISSWMDGIAPSVCRLRLGQVLERLGARLFSVRIEELADAEVGAPAANGSPLANAG